MQTPRFHRFTALFIVSLACFVTLSAQTPVATPPPAVIEDDDVIHVNSRLVVVPVSVLDAQGNPVTGLGLNDFRLSEENRNQAIDSVGTAESVPLEIALLFDVSASTDAMFRFQQETAAKFLRDVMRADDRATIFTVGQRPVLVQSRENAERSAAAVSGIVPTKEQTAFYDAVRMAAEHLRQNSPEGRRKVIVIISDGEDTNSDGVTKAIWEAERKVTENIQGAKLRELRVKARDTAKAQEQVKVLKALQDADAVLYSINPAGSSYQLNSISQFGQENMQKFADDTGGTAFLPKFLPIDTANNYENTNNMRKNSDILERIFRQLANELRAQYLVQYYSDGEFADGKFVRVRLDLVSNSGARVRARQGYYVKN